MCVSASRCIIFFEWFNSFSRDSAWNILRPTFELMVCFTSHKRNFRRFDLWYMVVLTRDCGFVNLRLDCLELFTSVNLVNNDCYFSSNGLLKQYMTRIFICICWKCLRTFLCCISLRICKQLCKTKLGCLKSGFAYFSRMTVSRSFCTEGLHFWKQMCSGLTFFLLWNCFMTFRYVEW